MAISLVRDVTRRHQSWKLLGNAVLYITDSSVIRPVAVISTTLEDPARSGVVIPPTDTNSTVSIRRSRDRILDGPGERASAAFQDSPRWGPSMGELIQWHRNCGDCYYCCSLAGARWHDDRLRKRKSSRSFSLISVCKHLPDLFPLGSRLHRVNTQWKRPPSLAEERANRFNRAKRRLPQEDNRSLLPLTMHAKEG